MSYSPTTWTTGDTITATKLNKIEQGIADSGGGGYDAEVYVYHDNNSAHDFECTIISGTFAGLAAKIADEIPPTVLFRIWDNMNGVQVVALGFLYSYDITSSSQWILFHAFQVVGSSGTAFGVPYINWSANDEVTV